MVTFYLTKTENRTKKSLSKGVILAKKAGFLQKNADISKIKKILILNAIFSETANVSVPTCQI